MKKVFFALMAAVMMFMVSCGASEAVKDGEAAAKEFSEAYKAAAGNSQAVVDAYNAIAQKYAAKHAASTLESAGYIGGLSSDLDKADPKLNGVYFGITLGATQKTNPAQADAAQQSVNNAKEQSKDQAAFQAGVDEALAWFNAPAPAVEEQSAEAPAEETAAPAEEAAPAEGAAE